jgi:general stress protein 26
VSTTQECETQSEMDRRTAINHLRDLIDDIPVAMLTTVRSDGGLESRPMVNINQKFDGELWFFTDQDDPKVEEIAAHPQVNVSFASPLKHRYVSASGDAEFVDDKKRCELHWTDECEAWFPKGLDEPKLSMLRIDVESAEFWDQQLGSMVAIAGLIKRLATGSKQATMNTGKMNWSPQR